MCVCVFLVFVYLHSTGSGTCQVGRKLLLPVHIATVILLLLWLVHYALPVCLHARERDGVTEEGGWEEGVESQKQVWNWKR